jgi:hypothetical protein
LALCRARSRLGFAFQGIDFTRPLGHIQSEPSGVAGEIGLGNPESA